MIEIHITKDVIRFVNTINNKSVIKCESILVSTKDPSLKIIARMLEVDIEELVEVLEQCNRFIIQTSDARFSL